MAQPVEKPSYITTEVPIRNIDCEAAFNSLDKNERLYSYYFSRASWEGHKICFFSKSYQAPALFYLIMKIFSTQEVSEVK